ncbi:MAG: transposase family protein [Acidimicrobiales bacterium]|nr:transposase family protein [Acidimicrobiales bacterium]
MKDRDRRELGDLPAFGQPVTLVWVKRRWSCRPSCVRPAAGRSRVERSPRSPGRSPLAGMACSPRSRCMARRWPMTSNGRRVDDRGR